MVQVLPLATEEDQRSSSSSSSSSSSEEEQNMTAAPLLDWNASGSIGSLLMQMQKKEEEMRKLNKTLLDKEQALDLSSGATEKKEKKDEEEELASSSSEKSSSGIPRMTFATAKELDESVFSRISTSVGEDAQLLELPTLYQVLQSTANVTTATTTTTTTTSATTTKDDTMPLSKPDHYEERIGRDMRHLAVSIASCIDDPTEWRLFCVQMQPTGALMPLVDCIREGAKEIRKRQQETEEDEPFIIVEEERFLAASSACRALRNLCALSLDLAAVITDGLLRANAAYQGELMNDLCTLLKYADDNDAAPAPRRQMGPFSRRRRNKKSRPRRNRRGKQYQTLSKEAA